MQVEIIRSKRKTICIQIRDGRPIVRAPLRASNREINIFLQKNEEWIRRHLAKAQARAQEMAAQPKLTEEEKRALADEARRVIPERAAYYAPLIGVTYGKITIRGQHTRWGSCSAKGNLNFNYLLMLTPPEVLDSVVVHELCHRKEMNHSDRFYREVLRVFPEYKKWNRWLKENGPGLMARIA